MEKVDSCSTDLEKGLFGVLQVFIVVGTTFIILFYYVGVSDNAISTIVISAIVTALFSVSLIAIFTKIAARWHKLGTLLFLMVGIGALIFITSFYDGRGVSYAEHPLLLIPHLVLALSWLGCGVLVWRGRVLQRSALQG